MNLLPQLRAILNGVSIDPARQCIYCGRNQSGLAVVSLTGRKRKASEGSQRRCGECNNLIIRQNGKWRGPKVCDIESLRSEMLDGVPETVAFRKSFDDENCRICPND